MKRQRLVHYFLVLPALFALASADAVHYSYDQAGRLARVEYANGKSIAYTYDDAGNLTSRVMTPAANSSSQGARHDRATSQSPSAPGRTAPQKRKGVNR